MAWSEIYVDPSIAADSGAGTVGDPYGDLEYAIEQTTFDTTNGTRVNIKAGADEVLAAALETALTAAAPTAAWVSSRDAPIIFQGYTSAAGDGGIGGISGGAGNFSLINTTLDFVVFKDLHLHNVGTAASIIDLDQYSGIYNCEVDNVTGTCITMGAGNVIAHCYIHNFTNQGIGGSTGAVVYNYIEETVSTDPARAINCNNATTIYRNLILMRSTLNNNTGNGILGGNGTVILNNSIYHTGGGKGIGLYATGGSVQGIVSNNLVEGWSGVSGIGIQANTGTGGIQIFAGNGAYDNTTDINVDSAKIFALESDNEVLSVSPFTDAANADFAPIDTGNVNQGALPQTFGDTL